MTNDNTKLPPLTPAEIAELRRKEAATKGPWEYIEEKQVVSKKFNLLYATVRNPDRNLLRFNADKDGIAHAELIVALRNAAPRLLAAAEREGRMRAKLDLISKSIRSAADDLERIHELSAAALAETEVQK